MKNKKILIIGMCALILFVSVAYAADLIIGKDVYYDNSSSLLKSKNVQDALDELYSKASNLTSCSKGVAEPVLKDGLIPVKLSDDGTVTYADTSKVWYNYCDKVWANAVILNSGASYKVGDTIKESDIQSYFVWIPKYKYKLWNTGTASKNIHEIDIVFDTTDTTDISGVSCKTPMTSGSSGNCKNGEYMTHPAFISMGVNGFWAGKFETGYKGATSATAAQVNSSDSSKIIIKPNSYSWRNSTVMNMFTASYNYKRAMNSHMMKNIEWGAVAYLKQSIYGLGITDITNNASSTHSSSSYYTGGGSGTSYKTNTGQSTTGNITGVYDMTGGAFEYVMGNYNKRAGSSALTVSTVPNEHIDIYSGTSEAASHLGDATGETAGWYGDFAGFVNSSNPWFRRGGYYNATFPGVFLFDKSTGEDRYDNAFRTVLSITK